MEYEEEGIDVASIGFRDNDAQVQLMDGRPFGMLSLLEEECHVPRGSDLGFLGKVDEQHGKGRNAFFVRRRCGRPTWRTRSSSSTTPAR